MGSFTIIDGIEELLLIVINTMDLYSYDLLVSWFSPYWRLITHNSPNWLESLEVGMLSIEQNKKFTIYVRCSGNFDFSNFQHMITSPVS